MFEFNIIRFIPQSLIIKAVDTTVDVIVEMGRDVLQEETLRQVRRLRSDGAFRLAFEDGLRRASDRFVAEYIDQDEDLVAAIVDDEGFFGHGSFRKKFGLTITKAHSIPFGIRDSEFGVRDSGFG